MYLLYLDESGNPDEAADRHFILAGVALFERQTYWLSQAIEQLQTRHFPGVQPVTFHASEIRSGRGFWRSVSKEQRSQLLSDMAHEVGALPPPGCFLFAAVIEKSDRLHGEEAVKTATEEICRRFDIFLIRRYREFNDPQRGLLVFAESSYQKRAKTWVRDFRELGTRWGVLNNLCDIPYFATPRETRLLQVADLVAHGVFLLYERRDPSLVRHFVSRFDQREGVLHGLAHVRRNRALRCDCPRCASERGLARSPWLAEDGGKGGG
jgi:hypothetical protein